MYDKELYHYGVKGMRWGVRRYQNPDGTLTAKGKKHRRITDEQKNTIKKVAAGTATVITVGAATAIYMKNKNKIDTVVKDFIETNKQAKVSRDSSYAQRNKSKILKSPSKLNKYRDYLDENEVKDAIKDLQTQRDLHQLSQDNIRRGANYVQAVLTYGTAATAAYNLTKSSLVKDINKARSKSKGK